MMLSKEMPFAQSFLFLLCLLQPIHGSVNNHLGWKAGWRADSSSLTDALAAKGLANLLKTNTAHWGNGCTIKAAAKRREWTSLKPRERKAYTDAVICLMNKPSRISQSPMAASAPGVKSRYDDFTAGHANVALTIHSTANFLAWHRYFILAYETALREECGYKSHLPYWNWAKTADDPINSPVFDGSDYSMGGNGVYEKHNCTNGPGGCVPAGEGGGCVETGPFKNYTVNLSPMKPVFPNPSLNDSLPPLSYFPRCLLRDISPMVSHNFTRDIHIANLITDNPDVWWFQTIFQGNGFVNGYGVHAGGHFTGGGDPGTDFFTSPGEPVFWIHHAQVDRIWWIWQNQDLANRQYAFEGTITLDNDPPSRNGTLDDWLDIGVSGAPLKTRDIMNTVSNGLCYIYV